MATLTETAYYTRVAVKWAAIGLAVLMVGRIFLGAVISWWKAAHPPPAPKPTVGFGILPKIEFADQELANLTYKLETVSGTTPNLGDRTAVYFMPVQRANLLALDRATQQAADLGFVFQPKKVSESIYQWTKTQPLPSTLEVDIVTGNFKLNVNWQTDPGFLKEKSLPTEAQAIKEAKTLLDNANLLPADLETGRAEIEYLKVRGNELVTTVSLSEADFVKVNLFRADVAQGIATTYFGDTQENKDTPVQVNEVSLKALPINPEKGIVQIVFSGSREAGKRVVELDYKYYPVDYENFHTYPLKPSLQAWEELQISQGFIAKIDKGVKQIIVRQVELAFFDPQTAQNYLQPVYVFLGDNDFVGYVPAIASEWVQQ